MAATDDDEMDLLLSNFDQIYEDLKTAVKEIDVLKSNCRTETSRREALELTCYRLQEENERLKKRHTESLSNLVDQLERRNECRSLREEVKKAQQANLEKENEHRKALESIREYAGRVNELEDKISGLLAEKSSNEATINLLREDLVSYRSHIQDLSKRLDQVQAEVESKYILDIEDLRYCLMAEQEEKDNLTERVQDLQKELVINRTTLVDQQQDLASNRLVETLKLKLMKLRKENEILKRKLSASESHEDDS